MGELKINKQSGLLESIQYVASPNYNERPDNMAIDLLVIHGISLPPGEFGGSFIEALFTNTLNPAQHPYFQEVCTLRVSSHVLIRRTGEMIQFVPFNKRAWHAGISAFQGRTDCNDFSIGIELEGTDTQPYEEVQYHRLAKLTKLLLQTYPAIVPDNIVGHCDIAPVRKTDPGPAFDWVYFRRLLNI